MAEGLYRGSSADPEALSLVRHYGDLIQGLDTQLRKLTHKGVVLRYFMEILIILRTFQDKMFTFCGQLLTSLEKN